MQACSQQIPVQICTEPQHVWTLCTKPLSPNWQNCGCVLTAMTHPHLANLLKHKQTATWHSHITDRHANVQYTPRHRHVMDASTCMCAGGGPTHTSETVGPHRCVCVYQTYIQTHALSHTQETAQPTCPQEHSLSPGTSTSLAHSRHPGCPGHTTQTQRQWNGTFNCL